MALLPPNSSNAFPNLAATADPTALPILVEPVAEIRGILLSFAIHSPISRPPMMRLQTPSGISFSAKTLAIMCWQATAQRGVFSDGFQIQTSPQTHASILFQLHTATGKLNAEIIPTTPKGCHCSYMR